MMKKIMIIITLVVMVQFLPAQTYFYKQVRVVRNGQVEKGDFTGQFITFTKQGCYDSDNEGVSVGNGSLKFVKIENGIRAYCGTSFWGYAYYYVKSDFTRINIKPLDSNIIYVYARDVNRNHARSCYYIKSKQRIIPNNSVPTPIINSNSDSSPISGYTECAVCDGTGKCSVCHGTGWYENRYDGNIYKCYNCYGDGICTICLGTGRIRY